MINFKFFDEWLLLKHNIRNLFINQRLTRFSYFVGLIFLFIEIYFGNLINLLGIIGSLKFNFNETFQEYFDDVIFSSNYKIDEPMFIIIIVIFNVIGAYVLSELVKRRLNDYSNTRIGQYIQCCILAFNIGILCYWGYNQSFDHIDISVTFNLYSYFFYEHILTLLLVLLPSNKKENIHGLSNGNQKSDDYIIFFEPFYSPSKITEKEDYWDAIGLSHSIDSFKSMFINKLFDYRTRAKRQELYWGVVMFQILTNALNPILFYFYENIFNIDTAIVASLVIYWIFWLWYMLANISCTVRRLHDTGLSGYWLVAMFIPFINIYTLYMTVFKPSIKGVELNSINE